MAALVPPKPAAAPARPATRAPAPAAATASRNGSTSPRLRGRGKGIGGKPASPRMPNAARVAAAPRAGKAGVPIRAGVHRVVRKATQGRDAGVSATAAIDAAAGQQQRSPRTPAADPAFQAAKGKVRAEARRQRHHAPAGDKRVEAENASSLSAGEQVDQSGKETSTDRMQEVGAAQQAAGKRFSAESFKADLLSRVGKLKPRSEDDAKSMAKEPPLDHFEDGFSNKLASEQGAVTGPLERQAAAGPTDGKVEKDPGVEIPNPRPAQKPLAVDPRLAAPKARTDAEVSRQKEADRVDQAMAKNKLDDNQLAESREPSFLETLKLKQEAKKKAMETPAVYRAKESTMLQDAQAHADHSLAGGLGSMAARHGRSGRDVHAGQKQAETATERRQREIKGYIDGIYKNTVDAVKRVLDAMVAQVKQDFANTLKEKTDAFNAEVRRRISDYYGDWRIDDELFGPSDVVVNEDGSTRAMTFDEALGRTQTKHINPDVYQIFLEEKDRFLAAMDQALDVIARNVEAGLAAAHAQIVIGQAAISVFKASLKGEELAFADGLEQEVKMKFGNLEASIDDARNDLLDTLADQYSESVAGLEKSFNEINDELKKSWIDRAIEFVETVGRTIFQLADLLLTILSRMASLIWTIVKHPIRFFETLVAGLMQGIGDFIDNIGTHLKEAFWTWITGTTAAKGIKVSEGSGAGGLFGIVLQVLSLTPSDLRAIVDKVLGPEFMQMVDKGIAAGEKILEPVILLVTKGPGALWDHIKDSLSSMVESTFERIKESVFYTFVEKGLKWVAGFFVPGGGFVKVVKAVFRAFQFVMDNLENIRNFFDSVFDSMEAATQGKTDGVAAKIVNGLKTGVVLALDFLAKQLGLGKIVDSVHGIIRSLRRPIVGAIEWLLNKVKPFITRLIAGGKELAGKVTSKALGGDPNAPPEVRVERAVDEGKRAVDKYAGRRVGAVVLRPLLGAIRLRHRLTSLDVEVQGEFWAVRGVINPKKVAVTSAKVAVGNVDDWPTGSAVDPIPIKWFKPRDGLYPTIRVRGGAERTPRQGFTLPAIGDRPARLLKVAEANFMSVDDKIRRQPRGSENVKEQIRGHLDRLLGLPSSQAERIFFDGSDKYAVDHVRDLTWRGADEDENLWPLDSAKNNAINASHNQRVRVKEGDDVRTSAAYKFADKYFIIKKITTSVPSSSSDHDTDEDRPINRGDNGIPKRSK
ncbi:MAG TPA: hypothetical protein VHB46_01860 [Burkholderiales bacterium]|nr:hypothetical protein [Burkholderiales bacterium]